ncbi:hypothetical protein AA0313_2825 [Acetobacter indonesiensis NRIC 0313]|uniref:Uncharacterized protein n=1 Tax=Acetobacter indonesiensis TaxID=104101 RepID=A0A6N3T3V3_9PROT|nr:hypothetical protein Abin_024_070 [Acetobacter indonesiensis]GBQ61813.1 hypothetical protein AA0313_2825 [Acetobacter indonesiensis NRIC 0313]GEN03886.1 hypothetical protein AIN02nite_19110 [Acetobacter indonesiensis]
MRRKTDFTPKKIRRIGPPKGVTILTPFLRLPNLGGGAARTEGAMVYEGPKKPYGRPYGNHAAIPSATPRQPYGNVTAHQTASWRQARGIPLAIRRQTYGHPQENYGEGVSVA